MRDLLSGASLEEGIPKVPGTLPTTAGFAMTFGTQERQHSELLDKQTLQKGRLKLVCCRIYMESIWYVSLREHVPSECRC